MSRLRGSVKLGVYLAMTGVVAVLHVVTVSPLRGLGRRRAADRLSSKWFRLWARWGSAIMAMRIDVEGTVPDPPFVLVSNHLGYVDVIVLAALLDCVFVSRADVAGWPFVGTMVDMVGTIFIDRDSKRDIPRVLGRIEEQLAHGRGIVIFPEGTSSGGSTVGRFKPSLLETAARTGLPVTCATLTYHTRASDPPASRDVCWWGDMTFWSHAIRLFRLSAIRARVIFADDPVRESDRKRLAARAHATVLSRFEPVDGPEAPTPVRSSA